MKRLVWTTASAVLVVMIALFVVVDTFEIDGDPPPPVAGAGQELLPPNIVLILADDMGWTDAGFMGSTYYETPNIDSLAAGGMVFRSAYSNGPNCAPTRASLMSGQYPPRHGIYTVSPSNRGRSAARKLLVEETETTLDLDFVTIAEVLRQRGYATASIGKWHLGAAGNLPTDQGFDVNVGGNSRGAPVSYFWPYERDNNRGQVVRIPGLQEGGEEGEYLTDRLTDEALRWMAENSARPFFLYLPHFAVHTPIEAKAEVAARYRAKGASGGHGNARYAAMIESLDDSVGRIMEQLEALGVADDTVVIFVSDNGGVGRVTSMAPLRGSKGMLYEGGVRVPMAIRWPGHTQSGSSTDVPVISLDLYPTLIEISGAERPRQTLDGVSLVPLLANSRQDPADADALQEVVDRPLYWHFPAYLEGNPQDGVWRTTPAAAIRHGDYKLLEFLEDSTLELYNVVDDIGEQHDLAAAMPEKVAELHALMRQWQAATAAYIPTQLNPDYDPGR